MEEVIEHCKLDKHIDHLYTGIGKDICNKWFWENQKRIEEAKNEIKRKQEKEDRIMEKLLEKK